MLLSIIIINYNTFQLTCDCIHSIQKTTTVDFEIVLIDNNSKECAPEKFREVFPGIKLIALKENVGFGRANNAGVQQAIGKYVLLLNSDTVVNPGTIDKTVGFLEENPKVDILGCRILLENQATQRTVIKYEGEDRFLSALKFFVKRNTFFVETRLRMDNARAERQPAPAFSINGSAPAPTESKVEINYYEGKRIGLITGVFLLLKRSVYEESKGFDPDFFMYYEETEWFLNRLKKYNVVYYPHATVVHYHGGSDVYNQMNLQFHVSSYLFWYKMGYAQFAAYFLYNLLEIPSRLLVRWLYKRPRPSQDIPAMLKSLPYFFRVLRYSNKYGARQSMLKLKHLAKNNL